MRLQPTLLAFAGVIATATATLSFAPLSFAQEPPASTPAATTVVTSVEPSVESGTVLATPSMSTSASTNMTTSSVERPARGLTMEKVEAKFGAPAQKNESVGTPPITRWEYPNYVVYFEREYVLHTVVMK